MPRHARITPKGYAYHVLNRAAGRMAMFRKDSDFAAFERVMLEAHERVPLPILSWCVMSNHWHFVVRPTTDSQVTDFFRWLTHTHAMRWRVAHHTVGYGHLYQGRFKSFPVQGEEHVLAVCRYVERNALSAKLVRLAENWRWSSLWVRQNGTDEMRGLSSNWPVKRPSNWVKRVNQPLTTKERQRVQECIQRGRPYGSDAWVRETVAELGMEHTVRSEGRPKSPVMVE